MIVFLQLKIVYLKWANTDLLLFIFVLFKHKFYRKTVDFSGI